MAKITLKTVLSGFNLNSINENFQALATELQNKVLYRDNPVGEPNQWETQQDANSQRLINLNDAISLSEPATLRQLQDASSSIGSTTAALVSYNGSNVQAALDNGARYATLAEAISDTSFVAGNVVVISDRANGVFDIIAGTGTANGREIIAHSTLNISLTLQIENFIGNVLHFGMNPNGSVDNTPILNAMATKLQVDQTISAIYYPKGDYFHDAVAAKTTCLQWQAEAVEFQRKPLTLYIYGDGSESRIIVENTGVNNVWMAGPAVDVVSNVIVRRLGFISKTTFDSDTERETFRNNNLTLTNFARIFNCGRMFRTTIQECHFEYCLPFFTEASGEDSNNSFVQQLKILDCYSTQHQVQFVDFNQAFSTDIIGNQIESGNRAIKIGRSSGESAFGLRIHRNTIQGNGLDFGGLRLNFGSSISIKGNYFESNRAVAGTPSVQIQINNNVTDSSLIIEGNFFAQQLAELDGNGADYFHVSLDEVTKHFISRGNAFSGGNGYNVLTTSVATLESNDKFTPRGSTFNEGIVVAGIKESDVLIDWTPTISDASTGGNLATFTLSDNQFTISGKMVTVTAKCLNIDTTGMTAGNELFIQGLPIACAAGTEHLGQVNFEQVTFTGFVTPYIRGGNSHINFRQSQSAGNDLNLTVAAFASTTADIIFQTTYFMD